MVEHCLGSAVPASYVFHFPLSPKSNLGRKEGKDRKFNARARGSTLLAVRGQRQIWDDIWRYSQLGGSVVSEIPIRRGAHAARRAAHGTRRARRPSASRPPYQHTVWLNSYSGAGSGSLKSKAGVWSTPASGGARTRWSLDRQANSSVRGRV